MLLCRGPPSPHLVSRLLTVVDLLQRHRVRGEEVAQLGQVDAVAKPLLQLRGGRQLLVKTRLHPPAGATQQEPLGEGDARAQRPPVGGAHRP